MIRWAPIRGTAKALTRGFTIVELIIVIVVIAVLATIVTVGYGGVRTQATETQVQSAVDQASDEVQLYALENKGLYPATLADAGVTDTTSISYQYTSNNTIPPYSFAVTASNGVAGKTNYYMSSTQRTPAAGIAPGHNLLVWNEPATATMPLTQSTGVVIDTSVFRAGPASLRLAPAAVGKTLRGSGTAFSGQEGQQFTVTLWLQTDATWNGTASNSKIRFGKASDGSLLTACGYNGVKATWTQATCSYTLTSTVTSVAITVGNDGTVGNIWIDDLSVSLQ